MAASLLEQARSAHEDIERMERMIVQSLIEDPKTHKETILQTHRVNQILNQIMTRREQLARIYMDEDSARKDEITTLAGQGPSIFSTFYDRLREIREYHKRYPDLVIERPEDALAPTVDVRFSGEEVYGRCLDLHSFYNTYMNLEVARDERQRALAAGSASSAELRYLSYLSSFHMFGASRTGKDLHYKQYLQELHDYLLSFYRRTQPLSDLDSILERIDQEFERKFADGSLVKEWSSNDNRHNHTTNGSDASASSSSSSSMETEGAVVAPASTGGANSGIYCQACKKSFTKESLYTSHLSGKKHKRAAQRLSSTDSRSDTDLPEEMRSIKHLESGERQIWALEYRVHRFGEMLSENIENTKVNIEKKLARTPEELEADFHDDPDDEEDAADDDDPSQDVRIGIQNYPVGWDGKPIPYWLYKLHGLGVEYKCEICGNTSYWGRRAFEKHFQEARHAQGMRILGIPNTLHFQEITKINDAIELWKKIKEDTVKRKWRADDEEEFEDSEGRLLNKKTYLDLKRQGLL